MAHFAEIGANNLVLRTLVVDNSVVLGIADASNEHLGHQFLAVDMGLGGTWKQTSYNSNFRSNFAGVGFTYDVMLDAFIPPKPYPSWVLGADRKWYPPIARPVDGLRYRWDEPTISWVIM